MQRRQLDMLSKTSHKVLMMVAAMVVAGCLTFLTACTQPETATDEQKQPSAGDYMTSVAKTSTQLSSALSEFAAAISENDLSAIQPKADAAYEVLAQMEALEAPDDLKEVKGKYDEATQSLKDSLKDYVALYLEIQNTPEGNTFDFTNYASQIEAIQKSYDNGLNLLEEADNMATEL